MSKVRVDLIHFNKLVKDTVKQVVKEINNGSWKSTEDYQNIINLTNIFLLKSVNNLIFSIK